MPASPVSDETALRFLLLIAEETVAKGQDNKTFISYLGDVALLIRSGARIRKHCCGRGWCTPETVSHGIELDLDGYHFVHNSVTPIHVQLPRVERE